MLPQHAFENLYWQLSFARFVVQGVYSPFIQLFFGQVKYGDDVYIKFR